MKPRPTEYLGVRYRSKSEAVFAKCLNDAGNVFIYESGAASEIHDWDFFVYETHSPFLDAPSFIEYKPSRPSETYIREIVSKIREHFQQRVCELRDTLVNASDEDAFLLLRKSMLLHHARSDFYLIWGTPWNPYGEYSAYGGFQIDISGGVSHIGTELWGMTLSSALAAAKYRFDLAEPID